MLRRSALRLRGAARLTTHSSRPLRLHRKKQQKKTLASARSYSSKKTTAEKMAQELNVDAFESKPVLSDAEYKEQLTEEQYRVARQKGTERPFTNPYHDKKDPGVYTCVCCNTPLFVSNDKYDSGSGWPSFHTPVKDHVKSQTDADGRRTEVLCGKCDAHLGHSFRDGPPPSGVRYCINSASLTFNAADGQSK